MILNAILLSLVTTPPPGGAPDLIAIRVGRAETVSQGTIEHAVILVEGDRIVEIGEDLPVERGIAVLDRPNWVAMPGLVNCHSRAGLDSRAGGSSEPQALASAELYPRQDVYAELLEAGVTTLGLYPPGSGIPGQAVAIRTRGEKAEDMILEDNVYLLAYLHSSASSKKMLREGFEKADKYEEKVAKEREKWEKAQEKKKKKTSSKSSKSKKDEDKDDEGDKGDEDKGDEGDDDKKDDKDAKDGDDGFVPPEPDPQEKAFLGLRDGTLKALFRIQKAGDYLHLLDALGDEEIEWELLVPLRNDVDLYEVKDKIGERELRVVLEPEITLQETTRRERNIPAELQRAGAHIVFVPRADTVTAHEAWLTDVGALVRAGLDRDAALAAVTLAPAEVLGLSDRLGSLEKDKDANILFWSGDPLEPSSRLEAVMLEGEFVKEKKR